MRALPEFPWDRLTPYAERARAHPGGLVDLSVGTPVDPTPRVVQDALRAASDAPGYPLTAGTPALREAAAAWLSRRLGVADAGTVLPTIGSKELVASLPSALGLRGRVLFPDLAYPTYDIGARLAGCEPVPVPTRDGLLDLAALDALDATDAALLWVNHPANPHGAVAPPEHLAAVVAWARAHGVLVASDECYAEYGWTSPVTSALAHGTDGVLAVHSLSKRSNLAGYRAGFVAGDPAVVAALLEVRRHAGLIVPAPVQAAMVAALGDDAHVEEQRERYAERRALLAEALADTGWRVDHSDGGLYLWASNPDVGDCWAAVGWLAERGVLVAPGAFYGAAGASHVRIALTATTPEVADAARRLESP
ncbi:MAG TPA: succinyldiaminopimelate transaminase [Frankiaceae bacterium]|jgi:succinyldiaminopimelate transaminase|nr:succinyldiaminopimelate transaminase [Frankiaceae bacterium]